MKITGTQVNSVSEVQLEKVAKTPPAVKAETTRAADSVELSSDVNAIESARTVIANTPEIRAEKVEQLRRQIQEGAYQVSADDIAEKMLTEMRLSKLADT